MSKNGFLFDIQGFSVHDGPGCRSVIFLKGCPLRCGWCSNPEGISPKPDIMYYKSECMNDHACIEACVHNAISVEENGKGTIIIDREKCKDCADHPCLGNCYYNALRSVGFRISVEELMRRIQKDRQYWGKGGGITLSGGEPLFQPEFAIEVLKRCYDSYIHTALETCGLVPFEVLKEALNYLDWIFFDIKHPDPEMHRQGTGVRNDLILENLSKVAALGECRIVVRMTIIPGFNDSPEALKATSELLKQNHLEEINILPLHHLGSSKYEALGMEYKYRHIKPPGEKRMNYIREVFEGYGLKCYIGSLTPF